MRNKTWIFDLDDTLHHASGGIFAHISHAMSAYMMKHLQVDAVEARLLRERYWAQYGATMHGLVTHHNIDPHDFLLETHKLEELEQWLFAEHNLAESLRALPGRKVIFSNGPHHYVEGILQRLAIERHFHSIYGVEQLDYVPKPHVSAFRKVLAREKLDPRHCIMVEDSLPNLLTAKKLGMKTIWVSKQVRRPAHVDIRISSIGELARRRWD
ncbi:MULTISPECIES: pyrimidine 5'-nucleotidase [Chromobacterium]|uniref:pyrimidine 5'-nucleotidase n=1 Tax=Chromobacterium TaxID=535 RepID=UPI0005B85034|nr:MULTISPECIES: pyrimidine 5'-nucleotidase [Chromobacterium]QOZ85591.1 pyrimidine 5'-nucleotidase [Chromobacterium sp. Rain0013]WON85826.1 pyrimidine 5'-nucleotidase [Chromobacterium haemolyticum]